MLSSWFADLFEDKGVLAGKSKLSECGVQVNMRRPAITIKYIINLLKVIKKEVYQTEE